MIPLDVVKSTFRRTAVITKVDAKDRERLQLEADMRAFLDKGGKVSRIKSGVSHDLNGKGANNLDLIPAQEIDPF